MDSGDDDVWSRRVAGEGRTLRVAGSVLYRQRVALPPGAVVIVRLSDVSLADATSAIIAEQVLEPEHQVPIPFSLDVERSAMHEAHRYALSAQITVDGEPRWTSDTHVPVSALATSQTVDILVVPVH